MKKLSGKLEPLRPDQMKAAQGGVVPVVLGKSTFDYTPLKPS